MNTSIQELLERARVGRPDRLLAHIGDPKVVDFCVEAVARKAKELEPKLNGPFQPCRSFNICLEAGNRIGMLIALEISQSGENGNIVFFGGDKKYKIWLNLFNGDKNLFSKEWKVTRPIESHSNNFAWKIEQQILAPVARKLAKMVLTSEVIQEIWGNG